MAWREDGSVDLAQIGGGDGLAVYAAEYPLPGDTDGLWSQWGQGLITADGRHISAVGDHLGTDGNSYLFVYDPATRRLVRFMDILSLVDHQPGAGGYGKVHAQMVSGPCDTVWVHTYWGTRRDLTYGDGYVGDILLELDPSSETVHNRGVLSEERGVPTMASTPDGRYLAMDAVDPITDEGTLVVYDMVSKEIVDRVEDPRPHGHRAIAVDADGNFVYSVGGGRTAVYRPTDRSIAELEIEFPSGSDSDFLRATTEPDPTGDVFGVMQEERTLFAYRSDGSIEMLASAGGYTTSLAMDPDGGRVFWLPDAHGSAWEAGAVVMALDTQTGETTEVVSLAPLFDDALGMRPGGTYSITYADGRLIIGVNASEGDDDSGFGTVVLVVVEGLGP